MEQTITSSMGLSRLHQLVVSGASLQHVKAAYHAKPTALNEKLIMEAICRGASGQVLRFLVQRQARFFPGHSDLHKLTATGASLPLVEMVYKVDPSQLTDQVMKDAFCCRLQTIEVLKFLVTMHQAPDPKVSKWIGHAFVAAIPKLQRDNRQAKELDRLRCIMEAFPDCLVNQCVSADDLYCPFNIALFSPCFPADFLDYLVATLPQGKSFSCVIRDHYQQPKDDLFVDRMLETLDEGRMNVVGKLLSRASRLDSFPHKHITPEMFATLLALAMNSSSSADDVMIVVPDFGHAVWEGISTSINKRLKENKGACHIKNLILCCVGPCPTIPSLLAAMMKLRTLEIMLVKGGGQTVDSNLCKALTNLVQMGRLSSLHVHGETEATVSFEPLLQAINESETFRDLRLTGLQNQKQVEKYQGAGLKMLECNTLVEGMLFSSKLPTERCLADSELLMSERINCKEVSPWEGSKQSRLDYLTLLNIAGRGNLTAENLGDLLGKDTLREKFRFLNFKQSKSRELFFTRVQFDLLRRDPSVWLSAGH